jgi:hypothetical protein
LYDGHDTELAAEAVADTEGTPIGITREVITAGGDDREDDVRNLIDWVVSLGYARPETDVEVTDPVAGQSLAIAEACWPNGLQEGFGEPVVLELDPDESDEDGLAALGYRVFTTSQRLREYITRVNAADE